jgi:hypothetical protein
MSRALAGLILLLLAVVVLCGLRFSPSHGRTIRNADGLVVHEWGTFTSVSATDGRALIWRPLSVESDLPRFVYSVDKGDIWRGLRYPSKSGLAVTVRMETPVLYFYSQEEQVVDVKVGFPPGRITEWYPRAAVKNDEIHWPEVRVLPETQIALVNEMDNNHYYSARETEAAIVQVPNERQDEQPEYERFLFYRGVGTFTLPLSVKLERDKNTGRNFVVVNANCDHRGKVVVFENRNHKIGYSVVEMDQSTVKAERPTLLASVGSVRDEIKKVLISEGLYEKEAEAMLSTWADSWFEEGLRIFYVLPRETTDTIIPINIQPQPVSLVRVLVGRTELITPEMKKDVIVQLSKFEDSSGVVRDEARRAMNKYGRFLESVLTEVLKQSKDQRIRSAAEQVLAEIN